MKFFAVFAAVLALAAAAPTTQWTLNELSEAIQNPATPSEMLPYLEHALNNMMEQLISGNNVASVVVPTPGGLLPVEAVIEASIPSLTTQWTLNELSEAVQNPATPAEMLPYLEHALNNMMEQLFSGNNVETIVVPTPAGLLPVEAVVEASNPAIVMPVGPVEDALPVAPVVVAEPAPGAVVADASGSPLVQIIININSQESNSAPVQIPDILEPSPVLIPEPVIVVPAPEPIEVAPAPAPVEIAPAPAPEVVPAPAPIDIAPTPAPIEIAPAPAPENPIDVIAVSTPDVNPIDLLHPVPVAIGAGESQGILV